MTQGYLFADYPANPELMQIFNDLLTTPVTKADLMKLLEELKALAARVLTRLQALLPPDEAPPA